MTPLDRTLTSLHQDIVVASMTYAGAGSREYAIFGSTPMVLAGIIDREPGDVDVAMSRSLWGALLGLEAWGWETPVAGHPPILVSPADDRYPIVVHGFFEWVDPCVEIDIPGLIRDAQTLRGYRVATFQEILRQKRAALGHGSEKVQKHRPDIEALESMGVR